MGRYLCLVVALCACAKSKQEPQTSGSSHADEVVTSDTTASAPAPPKAEVAQAPGGSGDFSPKGGGEAHATETTTAPRDEKPDPKELGKSNAALGTTDHPELFDQLAVKIASAKLGTKASTDLSTAVAGKTTDLDACFKKANAKPGTIELTFSVAADGSVSSVKVKSSTVKNKELESCVKDVAKLVKLDKSLVSAKTTGSVVIAFGN